MEHFLLEVALLASITTAIAIVICIADFIEKHDWKKSDSESTKVSD